MGANIETNGPIQGQKLVIIGGVAGGASCAARARRLDETAEILLLQVRTQKTRKRTTAWTARSGGGGCSMICDVVQNGLACSVRTNVWCLPWGAATTRSVMRRQTQGRLESARWLDLAKFYLGFSAGSCNDGAGCLEIMKIVSKKYFGMHLNSLLCLACRVDWLNRFIIIHDSQSQIIFCFASSLVPMYLLPPVECPISLVVKLRIVIR